MQNAELIAGLQKVQEGIAEVVTALQSGSELPINTPENGAPATTATSKKTIGKPVAKTPAKAEEKKETVKEAVSKNTDSVTKEELDGMSYNSLKTLAKERNIPAVGNRDQIIEKLLAGGEDSAPVKKVVGKTTAPAKNAAPAKAGKITPISSKQKVVETDPEPEVEEGEVVDDAEVKAQVEEAVAEMSTEDIASFLADSGVSAKGKRNALIERLIQSVIDGVISLDSDDDDNEGDEAEGANEEGEEDDDAEEDNINDLSNPDMTEERKEAIEDMDKEIRRQLKKKELKRDDMVEFLQQFYATDEDMSEYSDAELVETYIDAVCRLIDDSGETIEEGSYMLNGEPACCGRHLDYDEKNSRFVCEQCGETYDAE